MVTPVKTECYIITEETTDNTTPSKYIVIMWTGHSERVWIESFNTEKEAQDFMKENYNEITSPKNNEKANETNFKEDFAYANVGYTDYFWQIEEIL